MPPIEVRDCPQDAVLWPILGYNDEGQAVVSDEPIALNAVEGRGVRWLQKRREALDAQGNTVLLDATAIVERRIDPGSNMWLGSIGDLPPGTSFQGELDELHYVATYKETPDIKGREVRRTVGLVRFRDALPTQASPNG